MSGRSKLAWVVALTSGLAACEGAEGPLMKPGENCMSCHATNEEAKFTIAGTVFGSPSASADQGVEGATVLITDHAGRTLTLTSNPAGNFYTAEQVSFPIEVAVERGGERLAMPIAAMSGACNSCHSPGNSAGAPGRLYVP